MPATEAQSDLSSATTNETPDRIPDLAALALLLVVMFAVFSPGVLVPFGNHDDYWELNRQLSYPQPFWTRVVDYTAGSLVTGRPLWALLMSVIHRPTSLAELSFYRAIPVASLALLAYAISRRVRDLGDSAVVGVGIGVIVCTMPPISAWLAFSINILYPAAATLALVAGATVTSLPPSASAARKLRGVGVSIFCYWVASNVYQPAASFFWVGVALVLLLKTGSIAEVTQGILSSCVGGAGALALGYVTLTAGTAMMAQQLPRAALASDVSSKFRWFVSDPLVSALNLQNITPTSTIALAVGACLVLGVLVDRSVPVRLRTVRLVLACLLVVASYAPNLVVRESWASYRTQAPLTATVVIGLFAALRGFVSRLPERHRAWTLRAVVVGCAIGSASLSAAHFSRYIVAPASIEHRLLAFQLRRFDPALHKRIMIRRPIPLVDGVTDVVRFDEFGFPTTSPAYGATSLARVLLRSANPSDVLPTIDSVDGEAPLPQGDGTLVIDMRQLRAMRF
jgi:hypothetical protein